MARMVGSVWAETCRWNYQQEMKVTLDSVQLAAPST